MKDFPYPHDQALLLSIRTAKSAQAVGSCRRIVVSNEECDPWEQVQKVGVPVQYSSQTP